MMVPVSHPEQAEAELNAFLQSHRVLSVDRRWVDHGSETFWAICIDYSLTPSANSMTDSRTSKVKIDYREVLTAEQFNRFAKLRDLRKQIAQRDAVPVYTIFTNEQLAEMIRKQCTSNSDLEKIAGVGDGRLTKYGPMFLDVLLSWKEASDAPNGSPV